MATLSVFDRSVALHHTGDDTDILDTILRMFVEQGPERMALVEAALARQDAKSLEREAHGLKGAAATLGMEQLRQASYAVERLGADGRLDEAVAGVAAMRVAMDAAVAALRKELA
ncbi:MAG: Hpt domain-containing protein [Longimicrobiales bacterium]